jgi:hypothetical protein
VPTGMLGAGSKLEVSIASVYTLVAGVVGINGPDGTITDVDISNLQSPNVAKEFIPGMYDGGNVELDINFDGTQFSTLWGFYRTMQVWRITFSSGSKWDFSGYLNKLPTEIPLDDKVGAPCSIKVTGKPSFTP